MKRWACALGLLLLGGVAPPSALAQTVGGLDIRLERDTRPGVLSSALVVNLKVTVTDRASAVPPQADFEVYASADTAAGAQTEIFPCAEEYDSNPVAIRGVYLCTVLVDHGGRWRFHGVVNRLRARPDDAPVPLGRAMSELDIVTNEVAPGADADRIEGRVIDVMLLWGHAVAAGVWLLAVALIGILAVPTLRRRLSTFGLHRLEDRFDLIVKSTWTATGLLVASGTYLLLNQTAYDTPFSPERMNAVFRLPYGRPYFLALAAKLGLYAVMVAAGAVLLREARRRLRAGVVLADTPRLGPAALEDVSPWRMGPSAPSEGRGGGRTALAAPAAVAVEAPATLADAESNPPAMVRVGAIVLVAGTVGLSLSITLLKYFHELIEAARALL